MIVTDTLPAEVSYVSSTGGLTSTLSGGQVTWDLGTVPGTPSAGFMGHLYVTVRMAETATVGTILTNTAVITTSTAETGSAPNAAAYGLTVLAPIPDLYTLKSLSSDQLAPGSVSTYRISYGNNGTGAVNTVMTDTLPQGMSFVSATPLTPTVQAASWSGAWAPCRTAASPATAASTLPSSSPTRCRRVLS